MKEIEFHQIDSFDFSLFRLAAMQCFWKYKSIDRFVEVGRTDNLLFFMTSGERIYYYEDQQFIIKPGDIILLPVDSRYTTVVQSVDSSEFSSGILIKFSVRDEDGKEIGFGKQPIRITHDTDGHLLQRFRELYDVIMQGSGGKLYSKTLLSGLLSELVIIDRKKRSFGSEFKAIYPAIIKIEHAPQDAVSIPELAKLCFISESTFRRKFQQYMRLSPLQYRNKIRLQKSIELLRNGFYNVEETASAMGFNDTAHFCNFIKKCTGHTPSEIVRGADLDILKNDKK